MASTSIQNVSHGKYDVFLSFRGEDTRKSFTDHLYAALKNKGIFVFRDDKELEKGGSISPGLLKAIEESRISVIVLSKNYASSTWCLDELAKIVECKNNEDQILPIFYDVEPTLVRKQTASFGEAFAKHEEVFKNNVEKVQKWRDALKVVANKSGWELKDSNESEFIEEIVNVISSKIRTELEIPKELVGIESRLEKLKVHMDTRSNDVRMIGIWGMGGLGKTTLARVVYDLISHEFDGSSFLADVREKCDKEGSVISLQKQLLSDLLKLADNNVRNVYDGINMLRVRLRRKKVLVVIDDATHPDHLRRLVGEPDWFGPGSRIIITTRNEHLLKLHRVKKVYKLEALTNDEAFRLLCLKAFDTHKPLEEYVELAKSVVRYASGLPLALKVLGSFLFGRPAHEWTSALERIKKDPEYEILSILQISFDGLKEIEKKIFLDVVCFFKGQKRDYVSKILKSCDFDPVIGIAVLIEKSLLTVDGANRLWTHDLLQEMGRQIVRRISPEEPGKRSRLWEEADICHVLSQNTGSEVVEGIIVDHYYFLKDNVNLNASAKAFSQMTNLRLLKIRNVQLPEGLEYLSSKLRLLDWRGYPLKSLPSNLQLDKAVEFNMCYSCIEELWTGIKTLNMLKVMKLSHSQNLIKIPDFTEVSNLEVLDLEGCTRLREIHPSLVRHNKLILLNLKGCTSLTTLPGKIFMESLKTLVLSGCSKLKKFPDIVMRSMGDLTELFLDGTSIAEVPSSIELLTRLELLNLNDCRSLVRLPNSINGLKSLKTLNLSGCFKLENVPETLGQVESLEELDISGTAIRQPPSSIFLMKNLKELSCRGCKGSPSSASWFLRFPINLMRWSSDPVALSLPSSLSGLCSLTKLDISDCDLGEGAIPSSIGDLCSLEKLCLSRNSFVSLPTSIYRLSNLRGIELEECKMLQNLPRLPASLHSISLDGCVSLETLSDVLNLNEHQLPNFHLRCADCLKLAGNYDLALSLLKEYIKNSESPQREYSIVVPGSEIPEWFEYQNNEGSSITISTPPKTYKNSKLVGYVVCCVFRVPKYSLPYYHPLWPQYPVHELSINRKGSTSFTRSLNDDLDRAEGSGSCCRDDAGSTTSSERSFLKRSLEGYVGAAEASGSGCCNDGEEPQPKRFRQLE
ncbi:ADP-ribosyl cyclase/cyclic ADP-ribose hydrolase [Citrus sinensis]|nr:ADP-ribosyl cyclase/cyclic ADP-ribose hydrolase [Citrus sinensis]